MVQEIEHFFGVYLLKNENPKYKGRTYIGYTVNPSRRIQQHNKGSKFGGARRTSGKGPWQMVLIIHGFPNDISALRFEWAWQHPKSSRRLKTLPGKSTKENQFQFRFRIVSNMLRTAPWCRLPLTIRWLKQEYQVDFNEGLQPPAHMPMAYGLVKSIKVAQSPKKKGKKNKKKSEEGEADSDMHLASQTIQKSRCKICVKRMESTDNVMSCLYPRCSMVAHVTCLANAFLYKTDELIPIDGSCPSCKEVLLWGDLVRKKNGCYDAFKELGEESSEDHWSQALQVI
ncbi:structure-specific endonuclease subunit slx1-like [Antedon mediterranea]|uniref:structure-specific endonuclease subunit slx1-like n=1 Tax=Antedon mediterranea TaxID=105859 RepID=UPI003AF4CE89